jgi:hypothetical protein
MAEFDIETTGGDLVDLPPGTEGDWITLGDIEIRCGALAIGDAAYPADTKTVKLPNGTYAVAVRQYTKMGFTYNTRLRVANRTPYTHDCNLASYGIDSASVILADASLQAAYQRLPPVQQDAFFETCLAVEEHLHLLPDQTGIGPAWAVATGHGDGIYDIISLVAEDQLVGYETIFIGATPPTVRPRPVSCLP